MKKYAIYTIFGLAVAATGISITENKAYSGALWDTFKNITSDETLESKQYEIEAAGVNFRGYTFYVPEIKSWCFATFTQTGNHQLECKTGDKPKP